ncbi:FAD-binding protein [Salisediminibacterium beveridgei]|uniref:Anaerobic glycerol-3-phosphate dehydrogenase subunit B n=1 Tax=Salisediminibacterium beveridgei TaxID=632773 RepID=A0A1D7QVA7_9BACI|nr:FAD-binding protein [Salisediminibacterium beveridgei]AOM82945.1 Anaerobic glycerol-3-phosphate dehydrogenase subunit B [Salisediminibacterium beveridgei]
MYDTVVIGQGLTGLLTAIYANQYGQKTALVAKGTGKLLQSTGVMDFIPGKQADIRQWAEHVNYTVNTDGLQSAVNSFQFLMEEIHLPYEGSLSENVPLLTGAGYLKWTTLYPAAMKPVPAKGSVVIVGFDELTDFVPEYVKANLALERPNLTIHTIRLEKKVSTVRPVSQVDIAYRMDDAYERTQLLSELKVRITADCNDKVDLIVFPSILGIRQHATVLKETESALNTPVTEAPGLPPNASALRLFQGLRQHAIRSGVRFYENSEVTGFDVQQDKVFGIQTQANGKTHQITGKSFISAGGHRSLLETVEGESRNDLKNYWNAGVFPDEVPLQYGLIGGMYAILESAHTTSNMNRSLKGSETSAETV